MDGGAFVAHITQLSHVVLQYGKLADMRHTFSCAALKAFQADAYARL